MWTSCSRDSQGGQCPIRRLPNGPSQVRKPSSEVHRVLCSNDRRSDSVSITYNTQSSDGTTLYENQSAPDILMVPSTKDKRRQSKGRGTHTPHNIHATIHSSPKRLKKNITHGQSPVSSKILPCVREPPAPPRPSCQSSPSSEEQTKKLSVSEHHTVYIKHEICNRQNGRRAK